MRINFSSVLLWGAMMTAVPALAQKSAAKPEAAIAPVTLSVTYDEVLADVITDHSFWMQGGRAQVCRTFYKGFGFTGELAAMHAGNILSTTVDLNLITVTFGPRYTWAPPKRKYQLYGEALAGEANGFNGVFPRPYGVESNAKSSALQLGGGMDYAISPRTALRLFQADWLRTRLPNSTTSVQNNLRLGAGIVIRFK